jgi:alginate O-acetyltransferase complex protein AlgI
LSFCTSEFVLFFLYVFALYSLVPKRWTRHVLLVASYVFYGYWNWRLLGLIWISTLSAHYGALAIDQSNDARIKKRFLYGTVTLNLAILGVFKYFNFFTMSLNTVLASMGLGDGIRYLDLMLPVGISFYTFQAIGYVVDVHRGKSEAERSPLNTALFVAFFAQLVAGPIERAEALLPQLKAERRQTFKGFSDGLYLIFAGTFKKVFIADNLGFFVEKVFDKPFAELNGTLVLLALYAFAFQIYCDFSGYTDIARGVARCLGIELTVNFKLPYLATSPSDFWRRWHITLSRWLRDYLYIPLGGNRGGRLFTARNLMLTMLLGGLWHGAAWTFVAWGGFHGLLLVLQRGVSRFVPSKKPGGELSLFQWTWRVVLMFHAVCLGWLFFRANSIGQAWDFIVLLFTDQGLVKEVLVYAYYIFFYVWPLLAVQIWQALHKKENVFTDLPVPVRGIVYTLAIVLLAALSASDNREFIYFQF